MFLQPLSTGWMSSTKDFCFDNNLLRKPEWRSEKIYLAASQEIQVQRTCWIPHVKFIYDVVLCLIIQINLLLHYQTTVAVQCRTKGRFEKDSPLSQSVDPTCCPVFSLLWTVWKWKPGAVNRARCWRATITLSEAWQTERVVEPHCHFTWHWNFSFMQPDNTFMQVKMPRRPLRLFIFSIVCSCWTLTNRRICGADAELLSLCWGCVKRGLYVSSLFIWSPGKASGTLEEQPWKYWQSYFEPPAFINSCLYCDFCY